MHGVIKLMFATIITCMLFFSLILFGTMVSWFYPNLPITKGMVIYGIVLFYFTVWTLYFLLSLFDK